MTWFCIVPVLFFTAPRFPFLLLPLCFFAFIIPFPWLNNRCFVRWVQEKRSKFQPWLQPLLQDVLFVSPYFFILLHPQCFLLGFHKSLQFLAIEQISIKILLFFFLLA